MIQLMRHICSTAMQSALSEVLDLWIRQGLSARCRAVEYMRQGSLLHAVQGAPATSGALATALDWLQGATTSVLWGVQEQKADRASDVIPWK